MSIKRSFFLLAPGFFWIFLAVSQLYAVDFESEITVPVSPDIDISIERFSTPGKYLLIWLAPEYGFRVTHHQMAQQLAQRKVEVWLANIVESLFLPQTSGSLKKLDGKYVAALIEYAHKMTGKKVIIAGDSYATMNALLGARYWQTGQHQSSYFIGAILFTPSLYAYIPSLGLSPELMPIASSTNIPIMIYQAQKNGNVTQFKLLLEQLQQNENPVYYKAIADVRSLFYAEELTEKLQNKIELLSPDIVKMITVLEQYPVPERPIPLRRVKNNTGGIDDSIKVFKGNDIPYAINLNDVYENRFNKSKFKGQITVVNFWATWCPPCVKEIPSLNRLSKKMSDLPFELVSINYAEDKNTILQFMKKVDVEFPVLLDPNGNFAKKWKVITFPSTFIIGPSGKIKFGVNAGIEWDDPEVIKKLKSLL